MQVAYNAELCVTENLTDTEIYVITLRVCLELTVRVAMVMSTLYVNRN